MSMAVVMVIMAMAWHGGPGQPAQRATLLEGKRPLALAVASAANQNRLLLVASDQHQELESERARLMRVLNALACPVCGRVPAVAACLA